MKFEIKKIIRGVIIGISISLIMMFIKNCEVNAAGTYVLLDSTRMNSNTFTYRGSGNVSFIFYAISGDDSVQIDAYPKGTFNYYMTTFCSDVESISSFYNNGSQNNIATFNYYLSDVPCYFSNGYKARLVYFYGQLDPNYGVGTSATFDPYAKFVFYNTSSSWQVLLNQTSDTPISIDFETGAIVSQNKEIIEQNEYIKGQINNFYDMQQKEANETQEKLDDINGSLNDDNVDAQDSQINDLLNDDSFNDKTGLSDIITAPLSILSNLTNACTPINLTIPYIDTEVSIPCMSTSVYSKFNTGFINTISALINGFLVYRVIVSLYYMVKGFKDPDEDRVEVIDL